MSNPQQKSVDVLLAELYSAYAFALKDAYVTLRKRFRPDYTGRTNSPEEKWIACAAVLANNDLNPYSYAQFIFDITLTTHGDVYENQFLSLKLANEFVAERPRLIERIKLSIRLQADTISVRTGKGEALDTILDDRYAGLSPIFSFAAAWSVGQFALAEKFRSDATLMLKFEPLYRELLGKWLPEDMLCNR